MNGFVIFAWGIVFAGLAAGMGALIYISGQYRKDWASRLSEKDKNEKFVFSRSEELKRKESEIKRNEQAVVNLYEITKRMSEALKFEEIFSVLSAFLRENISFKRCNLLILNWQTHEPKLDREYEVWKDEAPAGTSDRIDFDAVIKLFLENPNESYLIKDARFTIMPLMSEKRIVAMLVVEDLRSSDLETLAILSMEFALEIKKVLLYEMVERLAITDSLTGLYVRRYFAERAAEELQRSKRYKLNFAFLMADIDNFKHCNDSYGHLVGDMMLKEIARIIKESVREIDLVSRYGGEEFALILPETGAEGARLAAERIRKKIASNVLKAYDEKLNITISIGVAVYPEDAQDLKGIGEKADKALYEAKKSGKNIVCKYKK